MRALVVALVVLGCKDEPPPAPAAPAPVGSQRAVLVDIDRMLPTVDGAKVLHSRAGGEGNVMAAWCIDQADAVERVKAALTRDGWTDVRTRGKDERLAATKGEARFSARFGMGDSRCAGTLVSVTVMLLGKIR